MDRVLVKGWSLAAAAEAAGVSVRCARKWVSRYRAEGALGLRDRSSAPRRVWNRTPQERVEAILLAGTELPLLLRDAAPEAIPLLDTTVIHVGAAVEAIVK